MSDENIYTDIIFDENLVKKEKNFHYIYDKNKQITSVGVFLPKWYTYKNKEEEEITTQIKSPFIISYDNNKATIKSVYDYKTQHNVLINKVPEKEMFPLKWTLWDIKLFLAGKSSSQFAFNDDEILHEIIKIYKKYLYFSSEEWYTIHALWDISTYFYQLFNYFPLLELRGLKGTGKTKVMTISRQITYMASEEMTNPSEPSLFRWTDEVKGTKYIDEAEKLYFYNPTTKKYESDPRAELINSGFKSTGNVPRQEKVSNKFKTIFYSTYSPSMLGSINGLYGATEDRAIIHIMTKPSQQDNRGNLDPDENDPIYKKIRSSLYRFCLKYSTQIYKILQSDDFQSKISRLKNRDKNIWLPILCLADLFEKINKKVCVANVENVANVDHIGQTLYDFAVNQQRIKQVDSIDKNSNLYKILRILYCKIKEGAKDEETKEIKVYVNDISELNVDNIGERKLASKTICSHLDNMGFRDKKARDGIGTYYFMSTHFFKDITSNHLTTEDYSTFATFATQKNIIIEDKSKNNKNSKECRKNNNSVANVEKSEGFSFLYSYNQFITHFREAISDFGQDLISYNDLLSFMRTKDGYIANDFQKNLNKALEVGDLIEPVNNQYKINMGV